ncbi:hypothetical protein [Streptomyces griseofuscus]|uniref:hypothetical protein n=1 Tax=Streptomyces griseofuscus TaxID=146922 RepID=UPI00056D253C|nr:hypothetical protein [Streptomyces griseofuscus]
MNSEPENTSGQDEGQTHAEAEPPACPFHQLFDVTVYLDADGQCHRCAAAPTDADNEADDRYREIGYDLPDSPGRGERTEGDRWNS